MKNLNAVLLCFLTIVACSPSPQEIAIANHESMINGTKTDINFKVIDLKKIGVLTYRDSASILDSILKTKAKKKLIEAQADLLRYEHDLKIDEINLKYEKYAPLKKNISLTIEMDRKLISLTKSIIRNYQSSNFDSTALRKEFKRFKRYSANPDSIFADRFECTYSFKNPLLNNAQQEMSKEYIISLDGKTVLASNKK